MIDLVVRSEGEMPTVDELGEVVELVRQHGRELYLRFSHGPERDGENGCSRDYEAGVDLPGLSVTDVAPEDWWPRPVEDWVARRLCKYAELGEESGRFAWLLTGRLAGHGPDHEPVVQEARPVARVGENAMEQARKLYEERFEVGQDSRSDS